MYVHMKSESTCWTVGYYDPKGKWYPDSDHDSEREAAARVRFLNGGREVQQPSLEQLAIGIMAAVIATAKAGPTQEHILHSVRVAREIMDTVYKTEPE